MPGPTRLSRPADLFGILRPGMTVFVPGMSGESLAIYDQLRAVPERAEGVTFVGVHFPGVNRNDYLALHPTVRQRAYFMSAAVRGAIAAGRVDLMPLDYPAIVRDLEQHIRVDVAIAQVSPPDGKGQCSLGACYDFLPSVWHNAGVRIAHVNPQLPRTKGSFHVRLEDCQFTFESETSIASMAAEMPDAAALKHARLAAELVSDGATLQFGVGRLQAALLMSLESHRRLRVYSGMISPAILRLLETGAIEADSVIECGVALGDPEFYARLDSDPRFYFRPARETHDIHRIAAIPNFHAINSALEVDLFGQVNVDCLNGRLVAGVGGLPAFAAGARLSPGGRSIIVLPATSDSGRISRIVCRPAAAHQLVALARHEADDVVTEYGVARLRHLSLHQRAAALIAIAAPQFRDPLHTAWYEVARQL
jgi:acyl-CoA hydrolase